jgi:MFS family permease
MEKLRRNRYSFFAAAGIRVLFSNMAYLFGNVYIYQRLGLWCMMGWCVVLLLSTSLVNIPSQYAIARLGTRVTFVVGALLEVAALYAMGFQLTVYSFIPIAILYGLGIGAHGAAANTMNGIVLEESNYGRQGAWWSNVMAVLGLLAPLVATYVIRDANFQVLFLVLIAGYLVGLLPLLFYREDGKKIEYSSPHILHSLRRLRGEYNFRSDVWRLLLANFEGECYLSGTMLLLMLLYVKDITIFGWVVTVGALLALVIRRLMGVRFDSGKVNIPFASTALSGGSWFLYILLISNPLYSLFARVGSSLGAAMEAAPWQTQYYNNIKRYQTDHYTTTTSLLGPLGGLATYVIISLAYVLTGGQIIPTLFIVNFLSVSAPLLRYFFLNRQERNQLTD